MKRATVTEAEFRRAIKAATDCGLTVQECVMTPAEVRLVFVKVDEKPEDNNTPKLQDWSEWQKCR